jgi:hypothetical protein
MNTTTPKGLSKDEYNALIHAIWRIDNLLKVADEILTEKERITLTRDKEALHDLFVRLA